jgi:hypothetical protein
MDVRNRRRWLNRHQRPSPDRALHEEDDDYEMIGTGEKENSIPSAAVSSPSFRARSPSIRRNFGRGQQRSVQQFSGTHDREESNLSHSDTTRAPFTESPSHRYHNPISPVRESQRFGTSISNVSKQEGNADHLDDEDEPPRLLLRTTENEPQIQGSSNTEKTSQSTMPQSSSHNQKICCQRDPIPFDERESRRKMERERIMRLMNGLDALLVDTPKNARRHSSLGTPKQVASTTQTPEIPKTAQEREKIKTLMQGLDLLLVDTPPAAAMKSPPTFQAQSPKLGQTRTAELSVTSDQETVIAKGSAQGTFSPLQSPHSSKAQFGLSVAKATSSGENSHRTATTHTETPMQSYSSECTNNTTGNSEPRDSGDYDEVQVGLQTGQGSTGERSKGNHSLTAESILDSHNSQSLDTKSSNLGTIFLGLTSSHDQTQSVASERSQGRSSCLESTAGEHSLTSEQSMFSNNANIDQIFPISSQASSATEQAGPSLSKRPGAYKSDDKQVLHCTNEQQISTSRSKEKDVEPTQSWLRPEAPLVQPIVPAEGSVAAYNEQQAHKEDNSTQQGFFEKHNQNAFNETSRKSTGTAPTFLAQEQRPIQGQHSGSLAQVGPQSRQNLPPSMNQHTFSTQTQLNGSALSHSQAVGHGQPHLPVPAETCYGRHVQMHKHHNMNKDACCVIHGHAEKTHNHGSFHSASPVPPQTREQGSMQIRLAGSAPSAPPGAMEQNISQPPQARGRSQDCRMVPGEADHPNHITSAGSEPHWAHQSHIHSQEQHSTAQMQRQQVESFPSLALQTKPMNMHPTDPGLGQPQQYQLNYHLPHENHRPPTYPFQNQPIFPARQPQMPPPQMPPSSPTTDYYNNMLEGLKAAPPPPPQPTMMEPTYRQHSPVGSGGHLEVKTIRTATSSSHPVAARKVLARSIESQEAQFNHGSMEAVHDKNLASTPLAKTKHSRYHRGGKFCEEQEVTKPERSVKRDAPERDDRQPANHTPTPRRNREQHFNVRRNDNDTDDVTVATTTITTGTVGTPGTTGTAGTMGTDFAPSETFSSCASSDEEEEEDEGVGAAFAQNVQSMMGMFEYIRLPSLTNCVTNTKSIVESVTSSTDKLCIKGPPPPKDKKKGRKKRHRRKRQSAPSTLNTSKNAGTKDPQTGLHFF